MSVRMAGVHLLVLLVCSFGAAASNTRDECLPLKAKLRSGVGLASDEKELLFDCWCNEHSRVFSGERLEIFKENLDTIAAHNSQNVSWKMGLNPFTALNATEFRRFHAPRSDAATRETRREPSTTFVYDGPRASLPESVDWTAAGKLAPVANQGSCGSCWAFAAVGTMEAAIAIRDNAAPRPLSVQQMLTCTASNPPGPPYWSNGCHGGDADYSGWMWVHNKSGGLCAAEEWPYTSGSGQLGKCNINCTLLNGTKPRTYQRVKENDEQSLMAAVAQQPCSVGVEADQSAFQFYSGEGVMSGTCGISLDTQLIVVGYGTDGGQDYWKLKNSWGKAWGDDGYIRILRGKAQQDGQCGVLKIAEFPVF